MSSEIFYCGPLAVSLTAQTQALRAKVVEALDLYTVTWPPPLFPISIDIRERDSFASMPAGTYMKCSRMNVDPVAGGLRAAVPSGAECIYLSANSLWSISVPLNGQHVPEDVEDLIGLVLTNSWRQAKWVPIHAGAIVNGSICAILCAPSGGGKTTVTASMIRRGWQTLGDDKILLRLQSNGSPLLAALLHNFNLHPKTRDWFPEVGDLTHLPRYSAWTEKRKVRIVDIWPGSEVLHAVPTHLIQLERSEQPKAVELTKLTPDEVLSIFLRQTVIPKDRSFAQLILSTVASTAQRLTGWRVEVGDQAYHDPDCLLPLERVLQ
ncbi:MAG TPA: hypothetical protein VFF70_10335 [Anaerolineae bacterium]|nr:hypothetical protein [Anaerolineae bacterium]